MTTQPRSAAAPARTPKPARILAVLLLAAGFVAALLPAFHWSLGTAATAMTYLVGTAALITAGIVVVFFAERMPEGAADAEGEAK